MYMSSFSVNQSNPLIPNNNNYKLGRKLVSIHSEDRDISKWKTSSHFEVDLPSELKNVTSLRLLDVQLPANYYVFTDNYQNTKISFSIEPTESVNKVPDPTDGPNGGRDNTQYTALFTKNAGATPNFIATINEGFYSYSQMALEIEGQMNKAVTDYLKAQGTTDTDYKYFSCIFNDNDLKLYIGNTIDNFKLTFNNSDITYEPRTCSIMTPSNRLSTIGNPGNEPRAWDFYTHWGLGSYLGFKREEYNDKSTNYNTVTDVGGMEFYGLEKTISTGNGWLAPDIKGYTASNATGKSYYYTGINTLNVLGDGQIYMELDKYNSMDEIEPYANNSTTFDNGCMQYRGRNVKLNNPNNTGCLNIQKPLTRTSNGVYNAAFAKIPMIATPSQIIYANGSDFLSNVFFSDPPIPRIKKLKVKFRYHDGRLVDFRGNDLTFTIEANELKNEMIKNQDIRVPAHYIL